MLPRSDTSARHAPDEQPRRRLPDHSQTLPAPAELDKLLDPDHQARALWELAGALDLSAPLATTHAATQRPGRGHTGPRLLVAPWLQAALGGIGGARELDRPRREHLACSWLWGGVALTSPFNMARRPL